MFFPSVRLCYGNKKTALKLKVIIYRSWKIIDTKLISGLVKKKMLIEKLTFSSPPPQIRFLTHPGRIGGKIKKMESFGNIFLVKGNLLFSLSTLSGNTKMYYSPQKIEHTRSDKNVNSIPHSNPKMEHTQPDNRKHDYWNKI